MRRHHPGARAALRRHWPGCCVEVERPEQAKENRPKAAGVLACAYALRLN